MSIRDVFISQVALFNFKAATNAAVLAVLFNPRTYVLLKLSRHVKTLKRIMKMIFLSSEITLICWTLS